MADTLLTLPEPQANPAWGRLYAARGEEVVGGRPVFTGDVFEGVVVRHGDAERTRKVMIVQHPCAVRSDGIHLNKRLLVVEVDRCGLLDPEHWQGNFDKMPLPELLDHDNERWRNPAAYFDRFYVASPEALAAGKRLMCMSQTGVNILMQRWIHYSTRVVVPTGKLQDVTGGPYEEADLIEEWCDTRDDNEEADSALAWLRSPAWTDGPTRQKILNDPEGRAAIRKEMRSHLAS